jgi:hypothetical protein
MGGCGPERQLQQRLWHAYRPFSEGLNQVTTPPAGAAMAAPAAVVRTFLGAQTAIHHRWQPKSPQYIKLDILVPIKPWQCLRLNKCRTVIPAVFNSHRLVKRGFQQPKAGHPATFMANRTPRH